MNLKKKINFNYRFNYKQITLLTVIILAALIFLLPQAVSAQGPNWVTTLIGGIASGIASVLGWILSKLMGVLVYVAQYNSFIKSAAIINGWVIARDISNMFFVVILLIIAFATILRVENYSYKKWLPKLILMAILINFSKTICGLLIDLAQVIMLTFVNAFKDVAAGSLVDMLGITNWQSLQNIESVSAWEIAAAYVLSVIYVTIALITVAAMVGMLVMRIVMLWVYVVLSPFAYLLAAFPGGSKYSSMWWSDFTKNLIVGPVLAFFIWLSFTSLTSFNNDNVLSVDGTVTGAQDIACDLNEDGVCKYGTSNVMIKFIIAIAMLLGGMKVAQEIGGAAAGVAGKISSTGNKLAIGAAAGAGALAWVGTKFAGRKVDTAQMWVQNKLAQTTGNNSYKPKSLNYSLAKEGFQRSREEAMQKYKNLYGGATNNWHDTFNKYSDPRQYLSWKKGLNKQSGDNERASELEIENQVLEKRRTLIGLSGNEYSERKQYLDDNESQIIAEYAAKAPSKLKTEAEKKSWAESQYMEDVRHLTTVTDDESNVANLDRNIESNQKKIKKLRDVRASALGVGLGFNKNYRFEPVYGRSGDNENRKKEEQAMSARTGEDSFSLVSELIKALNNKDSTKMASAFKLLAKNNDLNEALKDNRVASLMTENGGILENMAKQGVFGKDANNKESIQAIKSDFGANRVTPAYMQAMVQGMFKKIGTNEDLAARYSNDIGHTAFAGGNTVAYAMADGNANSGNYEFSEFKVNNGKLDTSDSRKAASVGKFNNMESQTKMRAIHPDSLISEDADGNASGITSDGAALLRNLNAHDLGQIDRMRVDLIKKIGGSKQAMRDLVKLVGDLEKEGNHNQAENVKFFTAYIQQKKGGRGIKNRDDVLGRQGEPSTFDQIKQEYA